MVEASAHISFGTEKNVLMPEVALKYQTAQNCIKVINNQTQVADLAEGMHPAEWAALFQHAVKHPLEFTVIMVDRKEATVKFDESFTESELRPMSITKLRKIHASVGGTKDLGGKQEYVENILALQAERDRLSKQREDDATKE